MIAAVVLVSLAAVPTIKLVVSLGNLSGFTLDWLLTFMALAIFRAAVPGAFPSDLRWRLPTVRQWGLVLLLFAGSVGTWVLIRIICPDAEFRVRSLSLQTAVPDVASISTELMLRLVGAPVLEEVFYRGFLLGELRRTMRPRWAVIAQGVIFGLMHYSKGPYAVALTTVTGVLYGLPRLFGVGIVPMILAHSLVNVILGAPFLATLPVNLRLARSTRCQELEALKAEPVEKALPIIIDALGSDDDQAIVCATMVLKHRYAAVAMPALGEALRSDQRSNVSGAIFAWSELACPELFPDMRRLAEDAADRGLQASALAALAENGDGAWIRAVANSAPDPRTRRMAWQALGEQPPEAVEAMGETDAPP
jgi:membrane protease YdiL (CAAX protease family)